MNTQKTMVIDGVEYVQKSTVVFANTKKKIVVLQRGWVVVGNVETTKDEVKISDCSVIRRWGTTEGLGELAEKGPTSKTKLDKCPDIIAHPLSVVLYMSVNERIWS